MTGCSRSSVGLNPCTRKAALSRLRVYEREYEVGRKKLCQSTGGDAKEEWVGYRRAAEDGGAIIPALAGI